jgi:monoterpene epsilon-lactone hydrolase
MNARHLLRRASAALRTFMAALGNCAGNGASLSMNAANLWLRLSGKDWAEERLPALEQKLRSRTYPPAAPLPTSLRNLCEVQERQVDGQRVHTLIPKEKRSNKHIIYTHGGAYVNPLLKAHWGIIEQIIRRTGATFTVPLYPLAPEHDYRAAFVELEKVYRAVIAKTSAENVILAGDSAGGGLALAQAMLYRDKGLPTPSRVALFSPWLDITLSNPGTTAVEKDDPMLGIAGLRFAGKSWAGTTDPKSPMLSPIFGNLANLPPIDIFQGTADIFIADARRFKVLLESAGGSIRLYEYAGAIHVFVGATFTPEAKSALDTLASNLARS